MNIIKKIIGKSLYYFTTAISFLLDIIIGIVEFVVNLVNAVAKGIVAFLGMGGCLLFILFSGPFGLALLFYPPVLLAILFFVIFPILGTKFVSYLKYVKYAITEFLFDRANFFLHGINNRFESFSEYGNKYKRAEEAEKRRQQEERQAQQQREWEERFKQWQHYQNSQSRGYGNFGGYQNTNYGNSQSFSNPTTDFKNKYEKSCGILDVEYSADKYQIKLAYRKKAKEYHPDINKSPDATKIFQQLNDAYEFLSEDNIQRYKNMQ